MRPNFRLTWPAPRAAHDPRGAASGCVADKIGKIARKPRGASLHRNRNRLRTPLPRFHTTKTRRRPGQSAHLRRTNRRTAAHDTAILIRLLR
jgi:hypothetical protein